MKGSNKQGFHDEDRQKGTQREGNNERSAFSLFFTDSLNMCLFGASAVLVLYVMHGRKSASRITKKKNTQTQLRDLNCFLFMVALYSRRKRKSRAFFGVMRNCFICCCLCRISCFDYILLWARASYYTSLKSAAWSKRTQIHYIILLREFKCCI